MLSPGDGSVGAPLFIQWVCNTKNDWRLGGGRSYDGCRVSRTE